MRNRLLPALVLSLALVSAACSDTGQGLRTTKSNSTGTQGTATTTGDGEDGNADTTDPPSSVPAASDEPVDQEELFGWEDFFGDGSVDTGRLEVPIDYDDPSQGTLQLFVARHNATDPDERIGSLLVNRGGPGFESATFGLYADQIYGEELVRRFDIIAWDPRGVGESEPAIDCVSDYDKYFAAPDITPEEDEEREEYIELAQEFTDACVTENADILQHVGTNNSARDIDSIRRALGEDQISFFGFSYGSELGATWATLFPDTVRAAVLDGASDPAADLVTHSLQQTKGFEDSLSTFLARCSANSDCPFHNDGDAEGAFDALMERLDEDPAPSVDGRPDVNHGVALTAVTQAMYDEAYWPVLADALAAAADGDGKGLLELYDEYFVRKADGTYDDSLEAFQVITCMDAAERTTVDEADEQVPLFQEAGPRVSPSTVGSYFCTFFPESEDPRVTITGEGAGPILVVGTTGDPATPLESSAAMADDLEEGTLLTVVADQHTGYSANFCAQTTIDTYLIDLEVPDEGTRCE